MVSGMSLHSVRWLVTTSALDGVGDSLSRNLLPIVAVSVLGAGTAAVGVISSAGLVAFLVLGLPIGVVADRWSAPRTTMVLSTVLRAGVAATGVVAWAAGLLRDGAGVAVVVAMALAVGVADVGYTTAQGMLVPRVVPAEALRATYGRVQAAAQVGTTAGPALLSAALAVLVVPLAWAVPAAVYLLSALGQRKITPVLTPPDRSPVRESIWAAARAGTGVLLRSRVLRYVTAGTALTNASVMAANTLLPVIALEQLRVSPTTYAALGAVSALTGAGGALIAARVTARAGLVATRVGCAAALSVGALAVALATQLPGPAELWIALQLALAGGAASVAVVSGADLVPRLAPDALGTVLAAQRMVTLGVMPLTAVAVGVGGALLGTGAMTAVWVTLSVLSAVPLHGLRRSELP